jgi:hypothetical protein
MHQINVPLEDDLYKACKVAAIKSGMLMKAWVARALAAAVLRETKPPMPARKDRIYAPVTD